MSRLKVGAIVVFLVLGMSSTGCSLFGAGDQIKQADAALEAGNPAQAINIAKGILRLYPRNIRAKRLLGKIEVYLIKEAKDAWEAKDYKLASSKAELVLGVNPENVEAKTIQDDAKKFTFLGQAQLFMIAENPVGALKVLNAALKLDPEFKEALELKDEVNKVVEEEIETFLSSAEEMMEQKQYKAVETMAQKILAIAPQNREIAELLHKAKASMLQQNKKKNLGLARKFYEQGLYESAKQKAELVLKVDENNEDAKVLVENCKAELLKPELRLTGFLTIKGIVYASIMINGGNETHRVPEGEAFGDFKVSAIDRDLGAVVVTYSKTGSQQTLIKE